MTVITAISEKELSSYGYFLNGDYAEALDYLAKNTPIAKEDGTNIYVADDINLHSCSCLREIRETVYGESEIETGYCNGYNRKLNCLEYHACPEVDVALTDLVLLLALPQDIVNGQIDSSKVRSLYIKAGQAFVLRPYVLHFSPCETDEKGFRSLVILTRGTNAELDWEPEDRLLWKKNKWLFAHEESRQASQGAYIGITGPNLTYR